MSEYKQALADAMTALAADPRTRFIGYGLKRGRAQGSLNGAKDEQIIETTVAEGLMASMAIGLSIKGLLPVVFFERADFTMNACDAIVNHLQHMANISRGEFRPAVIFRVVVGGKDRPLFTGPTHTQDLFRAWSELAKFPVAALETPEAVRVCYDVAKANQEGGVSTMLFEYRDRY